MILSGLRDLLGWGDAARLRRADQFEADCLVWAWRDACVGAGLCNVVQAAAGPTEVVPRLTDITLGPPTVLVAELPRGTITADVRAQAHRIAPALEAVALRIEPRGHRHVKITLLSADPLRDAQVPRATCDDGSLFRVVSADQPAMWARDEDGEAVMVRLADPDTGHLIVQGSVGSGKSTGVYGFLAQYGSACDVRVIGSDVTGKTLRPWAERSDAGDGWHALGTRDLGAHVAVLRRIVELMDDRIDAIPPGMDHTPVSAAVPLLIVVLEEMPGLMRMLGLWDPKREKEARALLSRIMGESRKAAMRALLMAQRADANIIGGFERDQASHTFSYRVASLAALQMLHQDTDKAIATAHSTSGPGICLMSAPGVPLRRMRSPYTSYADYCRDVAEEWPWTGGAAA